MTYAVMKMARGKSKNMDWTVECSDSNKKGFEEEDSDSDEENNHSTNEEPIADYVEQQEEDEKSALHARDIPDKEMTDSPAQSSIDRQAVVPKDTDFHSVQIVGSISHKIGCLFLLDADMVRYEL